METNKIYLGDAYQLIKEIPDKSIDLIYTDIPYDYTIGGGGGLLKNETRRKTYYETIAKFDNGIDYSILDDFCRVLKNIYVYIWCSKEQIPFLLDYFVTKKKCVFNILVWCKTNPTPFSCGNFLPDIEYCLVFREKGKTKLNDGYHLKSKWYLSAINKEDKRNFEHATIKPIELVERHIALSTQEGDIVLDPFVGSGTTALACKHLNRKYIGYEIDTHYFDICCKRLKGENIRGELNLFDIDYDIQDDDNTATNK